jgi:hypothetical protein
MTPVDHRIAGQRDAEAWLLSMRACLGDGESLGRYFLRELQGRPSEWGRGFLARIEKELAR